MSHGISEFARTEALTASETIPKVMLSCSSSTEIQWPPQTKAEGRKRSKESTTWTHHLRSLALFQWLFILSIFDCLILVASKTQALMTRTEWSSLHRLSCTVIPKALLPDFCGLGNRLAWKWHERVEIIDLLHRTNIPFLYKCSLRWPTEPFHQLGSHTIAASSMCSNWLGTSSCPESSPSPSSSSTTLDAIVQAQGWIRFLTMFETGKLGDSNVLDGICVCVCAYVCGDPFCLATAELHTGFSTCSKAVNKLFQLGPAPKTQAIHVRQLTSVKRNLRYFKTLNPLSIPKSFLSRQSLGRPQVAREFMKKPCFAGNKFNRVM